MAVLTGSLGAQTNLIFTPVDNTLSLLKGVDYSTITNSNGAYNITIENGKYNVLVGDRLYRNVNITADGSLNDFLENANGGNM